MTCKASCLFSARRRRPRGGATVTVIVGPLAAGSPSSAPFPSTSTGSSSLAFAFAQQVWLAHISHWASPTGRLSLTLLPASFLTGSSSGSRDRRGGPRCWRETQFVRSPCRVQFVDNAYPAPNRMVKELTSAIGAFNHDDRNGIADKLQEVNKLV